MATMNLGVAILMVAILPAGFAQSITGVVVALSSVGIFGMVAIKFYILAVRLWRVDHAPASTWAGSLPVGGSQRRLLWLYDDPRRRTVEKWFAGGCFLLFAYSVLAWQGLVGDEPPWRPVQSVMLSAALVLQPLAHLASPKSHRLSYVLLAASMLLMGLSFVIG
jgi:hypothetical protein